MASERTQRRIDILLDQAEEAIAQLDWLVVESRAQAVLALDPANADAINYQRLSGRDCQQRCGNPPDGFLAAVRDGPSRRIRTSIGRGR